MTPPDQELDPSPLFNDRPLYLHRLARAKYAHLSGEGAALIPGRWNSWREEAIYTSHQLATTLLERLVHTEKNKIPADLKLLKIKIDGKWSMQHNQLSDESSKATLVAIPTLQEAWDAYSGSGIMTHPAHKAFAVALPSVIAPVWNVVLYPARYGFWDHVTLDTVESFSYDPRLFAEDAVLEPQT